MLLPQFECNRPTSVKEACQILDNGGDQAKVLAGGTDLLVNMKRKLVRPTQLVSLDLLPDFNRIEAPNGEITIGAGATAATLARDETINRSCQVLALGAGKLGSPLIRNRATLGGNLASARPAADMSLPLLVLGARVVLTSTDGTREVDLTEFFTGPGQSVMKPGEILTRIVFPRPEPGTGGGFEKLGLRRALEIAIVNVAAVLTLEADGKTIKSARIALGAVAPTPIRSPQAEKNPDR